MRKTDRCSGYDEGYEDGRDDAADDSVSVEDYDRDVAWEGDRVVRRLLEEVSRRQAGADLPFPIYSDVMSLEEVRQMIRRVEQ